jgi:antirestriction protein ArdC
MLSSACPNHRFRVGRGAANQLADDFLRCTGADIREGHGEAYYVPSRDFDSMPAFGAFNGADHFYNVALHELTHWTGHPSRLGRDLKHWFGSREYAEEELVAELGAAFLCAEFGFDGDVRNAGYIASWIDLLKTDKRAFFRAVSKASQAADYISRAGVGRSKPTSAGRRSRVRSRYPVATPQRARPTPKVRT